MGFGINNISYKCSNEHCKAIIMAIRDSHREIESMEIECKFKED